MSRKPRPDGRGLVMPPGRKIPRTSASKPKRPDVPAGELAATPEVAKAAGELMTLASILRNCEGCGAGPVVLGSGFPRAPVMFVKGSPSAADLDAGLAFTDEAEALLKAI